MGLEWEWKSICFLFFGAISNIQWTREKVIFNVLTFQTKNMNKIDILWQIINSHSIHRVQFTCECANNPHLHFLCHLESLSLSIQ